MMFRRLLGLLLLLAVVTVPELLHAQTQFIAKGKVTDAKTNAPLSGATIRVKNSLISVAADADGNFTVKAPSGESILTISYVGYKIYEIKAGGNLNIALVSLESDLNDVVVVGYARQKKIHLTGAVETFNPKDVEDLPVANAATALASRVLGLGVSGGTTRPGSAPTLTIRNPVVLSKDGGTTSPLYVIDGVVQYTAQGVPDDSYFNSLDASEIESISILKDAAAAIYGARSANGVVMVTTKRGKAGKPKISYSGSMAINDELYRTKMLNAYDYAMYFNIRNGVNGSNRVSQANPQQYVFSAADLEHYKNIDYDKLSDYWQSNSTQRHTLNVSGGSDKATYFAGVSYFDQNGNLGTLNYEKYTFRAGADVAIANGFKVGLQLSGNYSNQEKTFNKIGGENDENDYRNLLRSPRNIPYTVNGYPIMLNGWRQNQISSYNFGEIMNANNLAVTKNRFLNVNAYAEYQAPWLKGLTAKMTYNKGFGFTKGTQVGSIYNLYKLEQIMGNDITDHMYDQGKVISTAPIANKNGDRLYFNNGISENTQTNFSLAYAKKVGLHDFSALFAVEKAENESSSEDVWKETPNSSNNGGFGSATGAIDGRTFRDESGSLGYIGRVNYSYDDRYLAEFLYRTDASTRFAPENYWGSFYSTSVGWVISNESFFKKVKGVDYLKLRYSFGKLGSDDTKAWQWRQRYTYQFDKGIVAGNNNITTGMKMEASPNRDASWSTAYKNNVGVDMKFLRSRLSTNVEVYYNHSTQMLMSVTGSVPVVVGGTVASENYGEYKFYGIEMGAGWKDKIGRDFTYGIDFRLGWNDNKAIKDNFAATDYLYPWKRQPGQSTDNGQWGYDNLGMFKTQADIDAYVKQYGIKQVFGTPAAQLKPGMLYYRDVRGALQADGTFAAPDGVIDDNDQIQLSRKANNHWGYGATFKVGYKGFNLDFVIGGSFGGWNEMDARTAMSEKIEDNYQSLPKYWGDIYDPELNPNGKYPNPHWGAINLTPSSNFWKVSAFTLGMRNLNLGYSVPKKFNDKIGVSSIRAIVSVLNPVILYNPFDYRAPDSSWENYPNLRTVSFGLNVGM